MTSDHLRVLEEYIDNDYENTVLIMIPAGPHSYNDILNLDPDSKINLIALDMEVNAEDPRLQLCSFLKQVILIDNKHGAELAARTVADYCQSKKLDRINTIVCEGEFHNRGKYFRESLQQLETEREISVQFLDELEELSFAEPITATRHVIKAIKDNLKAMQHETTFIFCASDNLALGARISLSSAQLQLDDSVDIKIISFDASDVMRQMLSLEDKYMFASIDQKYYDYAHQAVRFAKDIFERRTFGSKITHLAPKIYSGTSG
jgi:ABC-type sugar transport system substrate-binding protein